MTVTATTSLGVGAGTQVFQMGSPAYSGTFSGQAQPPGEGPLSWTGNANFATPGSQPGSTYLTSGSVTWTVAGTDTSGCTWSGTGSFAFNGSFALAGGRDGGITIVGTAYTAAVETASPDPMSAWELPVTVTCPAQAPQSEYEEWGFWLDTGSGNNANGTQLDGSYSEPAGLGEWSWSLTASAAP
jgi:hypothetical protein